MIKGLEKLNDRQKEILFKTNELHKNAVDKDYKDGISIVEVWLEKGLEADKIDIPAYHQQKLGYGLHQSKVFEYPYRWCSSTIASILKKQEYLGHTVKFKTRKHLKDKKSKYVSEDKWLIFENTHEPIIDHETFDNVQRIRGNVKRYPDGCGEYHPPYRADVLCRLW